MHAFREMWAILLWMHAAFVQYQNNITNIALNQFKLAKTTVQCSVVLFNLAHSELMTIRYR